jgi:pimeloyl-ACP methyl ester carboxylesterase
MEQLTSDVVTVIRRLGVAPVHLVGLSMGGFVGLRIAARQPELLRSLTLLNTSAAPHSPAKFPKQLALGAVARLAGVSLPVVRSGVEAEMYGKAFLADPTQAAARDAWRERWAGADRASLVRTLLGFMVRSDVRDELGEVTLPTLVVAGGSDISLPPRYSREIHSLISGSRYVELPGIGHSSPVEDPAGVTRALRDFLADVAPPDA